MSPNPLLKWGKSLWFYERGIGGALLDIGPHVFDMLNYLFGSFPCSIIAHSSIHLNSEVDEFCICVLEYPNGGVGSGILSWASSTNIENTSIHGSGQSLFIAPNFFLKVNPTDISELSLWRSASESLIRLKFPNFPNFSNKIMSTHMLEISHFINCIIEDKRIPYNLQNAVNVLKIQDAAQKSLKSHKRVKIKCVRK